MRRVEEVWGTAVSFDVPDAVGSDPVDEVMRWFQRVDSLFSTWRVDSEICRIARGELALDDASPEVREVLTTCAELCEATGGCFDIAVGARPEVVPRPGLGPLDPSGFVKGWALERAAIMFALHGVRSLMVNAGGDVLVRGEPEPGHAWRVGVRHPTRSDSTMAVLEVTDGGVATSAPYERGDHILDPATGQPAVGVLSATVVGPDLGIADAWATTLVVAGPAGLTTLPTEEGYEGLVVTLDEEVISTAGFNELVAT
ncbi:MAG: FAD:protein FMN transferase [Acidimicrobiales bacterium]